MAVYVFFFLPAFVGNISAIQLEWKNISYIKKKKR